MQPRSTAVIAMETGTHSRTAASKVEVLQAILGIEAHAKFPWLLLPWLHQSEAYTSWFRHQMGCFHGDDCRGCIKGSTSFCSVRSARRLPWR